MLIEAKPRYKEEDTSQQHTWNHQPTHPQFPNRLFPSYYSPIHKLRALLQSDKWVERWQPYPPQHRKNKRQRDICFGGSCSTSSQRFYKRNYRPYTANANENNDNVPELEHVGLEHNLHPYSVVTGNLFQDFINNNNPWRKRKRSFNTNPLSTQQETSLGGCEQRASNKPSDFQSSVDINSSTIPRQDKFASSCVFNFSSHPAAQADTHRDPLDLSHAKSPEQGWNQPLNNNANVLLESFSSPHCTGRNKQFHVKPFDQHSNALKVRYQFDLHSNSENKHFLRSRKQINDFQTREAEIFKQIAFCQFSGQDPNKSLITKHSEEGLFLALAKKNIQQLDSSCKEPGENKHTCGNLIAHNPCIVNQQQSYQFTQNNQHIQPCNSFTDLIQRNRSQRNFRHLVSASNHSSVQQNSASVLNSLQSNRLFEFPRQLYSSEMGCIQSIAKSKVSPAGKYYGIIVDDIQATIDRSPTEIEEKSPIVLRYRTPYFRASASVIVPPIRKEETWTVGWIQACDAMKFVNQYGDLGSSSWEIPALKQRMVSAVSDSDGVSYPWYGNTTEIATIEGPTETPRHLLLRMNDNFYPSVTWDIPVSEGSEAHLTHIIRDQSFTTWLAAVNQTTGQIQVLRTVKWHFLLEIEVDPTQKLGKRSRIISNIEQKQPIILPHICEQVQIVSPRRAMSGKKRKTYRRQGSDDNNSNNHVTEIPKSALVRPSANNAQTLIWRPTNHSAVVVVPPKEEYKENNEIVWFTREPLIHGKEQNVRILTKDELIHFKKTVC